MRTEASSAYARLQALADQEAEPLDPLRFRLMQALARRADNYDGEARRVLEAKLETLLDAYEQQLQNSNSASETPEAESAASAKSETPRESPLVALLSSFTGQQAAQESARMAVGLPSRADYPELRMLDAAQATWLRVSTDRQLRDSEKRIPDNAGPLNSSQLVHRALLLMQEQSPEYLRQFLSYLNVLAWMEQMTDGNAAAPEAGAQGKPKRPARSRKR